jgi:hypothetical protein
LQITIGYLENVGAALLAAHGKHAKIFNNHGQPQGRPLHYKMKKDGKIAIQILLSIRIQNPI